MWVYMSSSCWFIRVIVFFVIIWIVFVLGLVILLDVWRLIGVFCILVSSIVFWLLMAVIIVMVGRWFIIEVGMVVVVVFKTRGSVFVVIIEVVVTVF